VKTYTPRNVPSVSDVESTVLLIWQDLLCVSELAIDDNFLLLGGESLLAGQAAARLQDKYGLEVSLRTILVGSVSEVANEIVSKLSVDRNGLR